VEVHDVGLDPVQDLGEAAPRRTGPGRVDESPRPGQPTLVHELVVADLMVLDVHSGGSQRGHLVVDHGVLPRRDP
jgi:hypothetical protein